MRREGAERLKNYQGRREPNAQRRDAQVSGEEQSWEISRGKGERTEGESGQSRRSIFPPKPPRGLVKRPPPTWRIPNKSFMGQPPPPRGIEAHRKEKSSVIEKAKGTLEVSRTRPRGGPRSPRRSKRARLRGGPFSGVEGKVPRKRIRQGKRRASAYWCRRGDRKKGSTVRGDQSIPQDRVQEGKLVIKQTPPTTPKNSFLFPRATERTEQEEVYPARWEKHRVIPEGCGWGAQENNFPLSKERTPMRRSNSKLRRIVGTDLEITPTSSKGSPELETPGVKAISLGEAPPLPNGGTRPTGRT